MTPHKLVASIARRVGADPWHGGYGTSGNVSVKDGGLLYITRTGVSLGRTTERDVAVVEMERIRSFLNEIRDLPFDQKVLRARELAREHSPVPSSEVFFHSILPGRLVVHAHHLGVLRSQPHWEEVAARFGAEVAPYAPVGVELAEALLTVDHTRRVIFLTNHGVVVQGDEAESVLEAFFALDSIELKPFPQPRLQDHPMGHLMELGMEGAAQTDLASPTLADYVFACGPEPARSASEDDLQAFRRKWGMDARVARCDGGVVLLTHDRDCALEMAQTLVAHVLMWGRVPPLGTDEVLRLVEMVRILTA